MCVSSNQPSIVKSHPPFDPSQQYTGWGPAPVLPSFAAPFNQPHGSHPTMVMPPYPYKQDLLVEPSQMVPGPASVPHMAPGIGRMNVLSETDLSDIYHLRYEATGARSTYGKTHAECA